MDRQTRIDTMTATLQRISGDETQFVVFEVEDTGIYAQLPYFNVESATKVRSGRNPRTGESMEIPPDPAPTTIEVAGNEYLPEPHRLSEDQVIELGKLGFDPEQNPNHLGYFSSTDAKEVATLCEQAFEVFDLPPAFDIEVSTND